MFVDICGVYSTEYNDIRYTYNIWMHAIIHVFNLNFTYPQNVWQRAHEDSTMRVCSNDLDSVWSQHRFKKEPLLFRDDCFKAHSPPPQKKRYMTNNKVSLPTSNPHSSGAMLVFRGREETSFGPLSKITSFLMLISLDHGNNNRCGIIRLKASRFHVACAMMLTGLIGFFGEKRPPAQHGSNTGRVVLFLVDVFYRIPWWCLLRIHFGPFVCRL